MSGARNGRGELEALGALDAGAPGKARMICPAVSVVAVCTGRPALAKALAVHLLQVLAAVYRPTPA